MNTDDSDHDLVGAYVLDALTAEERRRFEAHLRTCSGCRAEVGELRGVVNVIAQSVQPEEPSAELRVRVLDAATEEGGRRLTPLPGGRPTPRVRTPWRALEILVGVAAAAAVLALGIWNLHLQHQIDTDRNTLAYQRAVASAIARGAAVSPISGTSAAPDAAAALVQPRQPRPAYLIVQGLPSTPASRVYELWLIHAKQNPVPATVFTYHGSAPLIVRLPLQTTRYGVAAVTSEPGPTGSKAPTGSKLLVGILRARA